MATPREILTAIKESLQDSSDVPDSVSYVLQEYDGSGPEANVSLPVVELQTANLVSLNQFNTDFVGHQFDKDGNQIGRIYHSEYSLTVQLDILTVDGRSHNEESISPLINSVRNALYKFDSAGIAEPLEETVWKFQLNEGERADNLESTPTVRRWSQTIECWSYEEFETNEDYIVDVTFPDDEVAA
jgi:hypothetical protein